MASGMNLMMKAMGVDPDKLMADAMGQFAVIMQGVAAGEAKIAAIEASQVSLHAKLDAIMGELGIAQPHCPAVARMSLPASHNGHAPLTLDNQALENTHG